MNAKRLGIPRYRLGGTWVYDEAEVLHWFELQKENTEVGNNKSKGSMKVTL
jgi:hypothetical protein